MSQNFTDDVFAGTHNGQTDLQNMENNFAALKSQFSGASAPSNPVAGMVWVDTTNSILKIRNLSNTAWVSLYDFANDIFLKGLDTGLITAAMISDSARKGSLVSGETITPANCNATTEVSAPTGTFTTLSATNFVSPFSVIANAPAGVDEKSVSLSSPSIVYRCRVYVSSMATTMRMSTRLRHQYSGQTAYARFTINGSNSSNNARTSQSYGWVDSANIDVSALSGYYEVTIAIWSSDSGNLAYLDGMALFIE